MAIQMKEHCATRVCGENGRNMTVNHETGVIGWLTLQSEELLIRRGVAIRIQDAGDRKQGHAPKSQEKPQATVKKKPGPKKKAAPTDDIAQLLERAAELGIDVDEISGDAAALRKAIADEERDRAAG